MKKETELAGVGRQYAAAHEVHYTAKSLQEALGLHSRIVTEYPNAKEAGYSRSQIQNIVNAVVPRQELCGAQLGLAPSYAKNGV